MQLVLVLEVVWNCGVACEKLIGPSSNENIRETLKNIASEKLRACGILSASGLFAGCSQQVAVCGRCFQLLGHRNVHHLIVRVFT